MRRVILPFINRIKLNCFASLVLLISFQFMPGFISAQTINLGCQDEMDATIGLDRKDWNMGSSASHSEGYMLNFQLPAAVSCREIQNVEIAITVTNVDISGLAPTCGSVFPYYVNVFSGPAPIPCENYTPASCPLLTTLVDEPNWPNFSNQTLNYTPSDFNFQFGEFLGIDVIPVLTNVTQPGCQTSITDGDISLEYEICVTVTLANLAPANDLCTAASMPPYILTNGAPLPLQNNTCATTDNSISCPANDNNTVWYSFTMPANMENLAIAVNGTSGSPIVNPMIEVFDGQAGCGGAVVANGCNTSLLNVTCLVPGRRYYIQVGSTTANEGEFTITATASDNLVTNETCTEADPLNLTMPLCRANTFNGLTNLNSCPEDASLNGGGCNFSLAGAVWYTFTTGPNTQLVDIVITPSGMKNFGLFSGGCGGLTLLACDGGSGMIVNQVVGAMTTYTILVASTAPLTESNFSIEIEEKRNITNDDCASIPMAANLVNGNPPLNGTTTCATPDPNGLCGGSAAHTVYYSYTTNTMTYSDLTFAWNPNTATTGTAAGELSVSIVVNCAGTLYPSMPNQSCGTTAGGNITLECVPPDTDLIIAVGSSDTREGDFDIRVVETLNAVSNDQCSNPDPINTPLACTYVMVAGSNIGACPESFIGPSCPVNTDAVVWHSLTLPVGGVGYGFDFQMLTAGLQLVLYNDACPLPAIVQDCFTTDTQILGLPTGNYLLSASLVGAAENFYGFEVKRVVPPANDNCNPGAAIIPGPNTPVDGTNNCASPAPFSYCGLNTTDSHTVFYSYTVAAPRNADLEIAITPNAAGPTGTPISGPTSLGIFTNCGGADWPEMEINMNDECNSLNTLLEYECVEPGTTLIIAVGSPDGMEGDFTIIVTEDFSMTPANDVCSSPTPINAMDCTSITVTGNNTGACPENFGGAPCPVDQDAVVWYSVTLPAGATGIEFDNLSFGLQLLVFNNACPLPGFFGNCITPGPAQTVNLPPGGGTFLIAASLAGAAEGAFNFDIKTIVPPANDDPCGFVTTLNPGNNPGSTICATPPAGTTASCAANQENSVYFQYTLGPNENGFEVSVNAGGANPIPNGATISIVVFENTACNNNIFVDESCNALGSMEEFLCLNPNTTYVLMISTSTNNEGDFSLNFNPVPPPAQGACIDNDICSNAENLNVIPTDGGQQCLTDCNAFACPEQFVAGPCPYNTEEVVWYRFTTDAFAENLNVSASSGEFNPVIGVFTNNCPVPAEAAPGSSCAVGDGSTAILNNLVIMPNTSYLIAVAPAIGDGGSFQLCIEITTQCNDDPCTPFPLVGNVPATDCNNNNGATQDFQYDDGGCGSPALAESSVYFSYQAPAGLAFFEVIYTNISMTGNMVLTVLEYDIANCANFQNTLIDQTCGPATNANLKIGCPTENTVYLIQVSSAAADQGEFDIVVVEAPQTDPCSANDECSNAEFLDLNGVYCEYVDFIKRCNRETCPEDFFSGACSFHQVPATWYEVLTPPGVVTMDVKVEGLSFGDPFLAVLIDDCFNPTAINANTTCVTAVGGIAEVTDIPVTENTTYYIVVGSQSGQEGDYNVSVLMEVPPDNDDCVNAEPLPAGVTTMGTTRCATRDALFVNCSQNLNESDVWYTFTPNPAFNGFEVIVNGWDGTSNLGVEVYGSNSGCGGLREIEGAFDCGSGPKRIRVGCSSEYTQYYILVGSTEDGQGDFFITADDIKSMCGEYADECVDIGGAQILGPLMTDPNFSQFFEECIPGCLDLACPEDPVPPGTDCGFSANPTVWFQIEVDAIAAQLFTSVTTGGTWQPVWSVYYGDCNNLVQLATGGTPPCSNQDLTPDLHQTAVEDGFSTYYVAITANGEIDDPSFELCAYTTINALVCLGDIGNCNPDPSVVIEVTDREFDGSLFGPFCQGEEINIHMEFFYDATESGADWLIGLVPDFGPGWDVEGIENIVFGGAPWYDETGPCAPLLQEPVPHLCTYVDDDGRLQICNSLCESCPCTPGMVEGDPLPSGWFWVSTGGNAGCENDCSPGEGWGIGSVTAFVTADFTLKVKEFDTPQECFMNNDLQISFQTFSDGGAGCWEDPVGECLIDRKQFGPLWEIECEAPPRVIADPNPKEICTGGPANVTVTTEDGTSRPIVVTFMDNPNVTGESDHFFGGGFGIVDDVLINNTNVVQTVIYSAIVEDPSFICPGFPTEFEVIIYPDLEVNFTPPYRVCQGESITISPNLSGGSGVVGSYIWNTGATTPTLTVSPSSTTNYSVVVTDALGCTGSSQTTVEVSQTMFVSLTEPQGVCQGSGGIDPIVMVDNLFNGVPPYIFNWLPQNGLSGNPLAPGTRWEVDASNSNPAFDAEGDGLTLELQVTDSFGCTTSTSVQVFVFGSPSSNISLIGDPPCAEDDDFTLQLIGFPGLSAIPISTLDLYDPDNLLIAQEVFVPSLVEVPTTTIMATGSGTFNLVVTDAAGCTSTSSIQIDLSEAPDPVLEDQSICEGESTSFTVMNDTDYTNIEWDTQETGATIMVSPNSSTTYLLTVTDADGCSKISSVDLEVNTNPVIQLGGSLSFCVGGSTTIDAGGDPMDWTYEWEDSSGGSLSGSGSTVDISVPDTYFLTVTNSNNCSADTMFTISESTSLSPQITGEDICDTESVVLRAIGFDEYEWFDISGGSLTTDDTLLVNAGGSYIVSVTDLASMCTGVDTFEVQQFVTPVAIVTDTVMACNAETQIAPTFVDFNSQVSGSSGVWFDTELSGTDLTNLDSVSFVGFMVDTLNFSYTTNTAVLPCIDTTYIMTVIVENCVCPAVNLVSPPPMCNEGDTLNLNLEVKNNLNGGIWSVATGPEPVVLLDDSLFVSTNLMPGDYTIVFTLQNQFGGSCPPDNSVIVTVNQAVNAGMDNTIDVCEGDTNMYDFMSSLSGTPDLGGTWSDDSGSGIDPNTDPNNIDLSSLGTGSYFYTYSVNAVLPCPDASSLLVVNILTPPNPGQTNNQDICTLGNTVVDIDALLGPHDEGGVWIDNDAAGVDISDSTNVDFAAAIPGIYTFTYSLPATAVCPSESQTVSVSVSGPAEAGMDGTLSLCEGESSLVDLDMILGTHDSGGTWTDINVAGVDLTDPTTIDFSAVPAGTYNFSYNIAAVVPCPSDQAMVEVTVEAPLNPGQDSTRSVCTLGNTIADLDGMLGIHDPGGSWSDDNGAGVDLVTDISNVDFAGTPAGSYVFTYTLESTGVCPELSQSVTINVSDVANAGDDGSTVVCEGDNTGVDVFGLLGNSPQTGGVWMDIDGTGVDVNNDPNNVDFSTLTAGTYQFAYEIAAVDPCPSDQSMVEITVEAPLNPGTSSSDIVCTLGGTIDLEAMLGAHDGGGVWSDDNGSGVDLVADINNVEFAGVPSGSYNFTYSIAATSFCPMVSQTVTVDVIPAADAGMDGLFSICEGDNTGIDVFALLGGTPESGGTWLDSDATGVDLSDPTNLDVSTLSAGTYQFGYEVLGLVPCPSDQSMVEISIEAPLNPGSPGSITLCNDASGIADIEALLGAHDTGGTWSDNDGSGVDLSDINNVDFESISAGTYNFTYTLAATLVCPEVSETVSVTVNPSVSAGTDGFFTICEGDNSGIDVFALLGGTPGTGGAWMDTDATGVDLSDPTNVDVSSLGAGTYEFGYEVLGLVPCPSDQSIVQITIEAPLNPGSPGSVTLCNDVSGLADLESLLGAHDVGGTWSDDDVVGVDLTDINNVSFENVSAGTYNFTYTLAATLVCPSVSETVSVTINSTVSAGIDGSYSICEGDNTGIDVFALLGGTPETGGTWMDTDATGVDLSDPTNVDVSSLGAGTYQFGYEVLGLVPCPADQSMVEITIEAPLNPGSPGATIICNDASGVTDIEALLGTFDMGGSWSDDNGSGVDITDINNVDFENITAGIYDFTYTIGATLVCPAVSETVQVEVVRAPDAGVDGGTTICEGSSTLVDLSSLIIGTPDSGGTWGDMDATGLDLSDPTSVDFSTLSNGSYSFSYSIAAIGPCPMDQSIVTVSLTVAPNPGTPGSGPICNDGSTIDIDNLLGVHDPGGNWIDLDGSGVDVAGDPFNADFSNVAAGTYDFMYTIPPNGTCPEVSEIVQVEVNDAPYAGDDNSMLICETDATTVDVFALIGGGPDTGGVWTDVDGTGIDVNADPANVDFSSLNSGSYQFTYNVAAIAPCVDDNSTITIEIEAPLNPGTSGFVDVCDEGSTNVDVEALLGVHDGGGAWSDLDGSGVDLADINNVDFTGVSSGIYNYMYTIPATSVCPAVDQTVQITVNETPTAGSDGNLRLCEGDATTVDVFALLGGSPDNGGVWTDIDGSGVDVNTNQNSVDFSSLSSGTYAYSYGVSALAPCIDDNALITIEIEAPLNPGSAGSLDVCDEGSTNVDVEALLGVHDGGGAWSDLDGSGVDLADINNVDFTGVSSGIYNYMYTIPASSVCPAVDQTVQIMVNATPSAGSDGNLRLCEGDVITVDVFALLGGSPDNGGVWTDIDGSGVDVNTNQNSVDFSSLSSGTYTYSYGVSALAPCIDDDALITIEIEAPLNPGSAGSMDVCDEGSTNVDVEALLGIHDGGGAWSDLDGSGVDLADINNVDFTGVSSGIYNYMYTIPATSVCPAVDQVVQVTVNRTPTAGSDGNLRLCEGDVTTVDVFALLGGSPDNGGVWTDIDGSGVDVNTNQNSVDFSSLSSGSYTYSYGVSALAPCIDDNALVTIEIEAPLNPGSTGSMDVCDEGSTNVDVEALLGVHDGGGSWSDLDGSGVNLADINNVDFTGVSSGTYNYMYTIPATTVCPAVDQTVQVTVNRTPTAGADGNLKLCEGESTIVDMFGLLGSSPDNGGIWTDNDGSGVDVNMNQNNIDFSSLASGTYSFTYSVSALAPCIGDQSVVTIEIEAPLNPGSTGSTDICNSIVSVTDVEALLGSHDVGGVWSDDDGSGVDISGNPTNVDFDGVTAGIYNFTYTLAATATCPQVSQTVQVNVNRLPVAGVPDEPYRLCLGENEVVNLADLLSGEDPGGLWVETSSTSSTGGAFDATNGTFTTGSQSSGSFSFEYNLLGGVACPDANETVQIIIEALPSADAGADQRLTCDVEVVSIGGPGSSTGGTIEYQWFDDNNNPIAGANSATLPTVTQEGDYTLMVTDVATGCFETDLVNVILDDEAPTMNLVGEPPSCFGDSDGSIDAVNVIGGDGVYEFSIDNGNTWQNSNNFGNLTAGVYTLLVKDGKGCIFEANLNLPQRDPMTAEATIVDNIDVIVYGENVSLEASTNVLESEIDEIIWTANDTIVCQGLGCLTFTHDPNPGITNYNVLIIDEFGCQATASVQVRVEIITDIYVPNVFNPNAIDPDNQWFYPSGPPALERIIEMRVYDRWGELVYLGKDFVPGPGDPLTGWDGEFRGEPVNPGVFVYFIEAKFLFNSESIKVSGDVTVVR